MDRNLNEFQGNDWGLFGFFECEDDPEAAGALLDAAAQWLRERGRDRMVGPMDFTTNDECGLLVEGHDRMPIIFTPWQHPYYQALLEGAGLTKAMDAFMWELYVDKRERVHQAIWDMAEKVQSEHGITVRPMRKRDLQAEVGRFLEVYNAAWERNWGFVPLSEEEVRHYAKDLKPVLDENWAMIAEARDGTVVGAALTLPDFNQVLAHLNGRLLPFGWAKALYWRREDRPRARLRPRGQARVPAHRGGRAHVRDALRLGRAHASEGGETGWILESNTAMNRAMEGMGGKIARRYRFYEKPLAPTQ